MARVGVTNNGKLHVGCYHTPPLREDLVPRSRTERTPDIRTQVILALPSSFSVGMVRPLNFQKFDRLVASFALDFFKNGNGMLMIRQIFLELNLFEVYSALRRLKALAKLWHVKHVVHVCEVRRNLELIGEIASFSNDLERTHVCRGKLPFDTEAMSTFHWRDAEVDMVSDLESQITMLTIIVTLWRYCAALRLSRMTLHISSASVIKSLPRSWRSPVSNQLRGVRHFLP